jgi:hypothetical protein
MVLCKLFVLYYFMCFMTWLECVGVLEPVKPEDDVEAKKWQTKDRYKTENKHLWHDKNLSLPICDEIFFPLLNVM